MQPCNKYVKDPFIEPIHISICNDSLKKYYTAVTNSHIPDDDCRIPIVAFERVVFRITIQICVIKFLFPNSLPIRNFHHDREVTLYCILLYSIFHKTVILTASCYSIVFYWIEIFFHFFEKKIFRGVFGG